LLKVVNFEPRSIDLLKTEDRGENEKLFINPAREFDLSVISVSAEHPYLSASDRNAEILLCTDGEAWMQDIGSQANINLKKGNSAMIPAAVKGYKLSGHGVFYKAAVPIQE
jgi:mannose-6-phosphate isomerase class I